MEDIEIYFSDLNESKQRELLEAAGIDSPEEANWDNFPLVTMRIGE